MSELTLTPYIKIYKFNPNVSEDDSSYYDDIPRRADEPIDPVKAEILGKIRDEFLDTDYVLSLPETKTNDAFVDFVNGTNYSFIPLPDYYDETVKEYFDVFGGEYVIVRNEGHYKIHTYFYKLKRSIDTLTPDILKKFHLIIMYHYLVQNNIGLEYEEIAYYHFMEYMKTVGETELSMKQKSEYLPPAVCKTPLFNHQKLNISKMLNLFKTPIPMKFHQHLVVEFPHGLVYDIEHNEEGGCISPDDIPIRNVSGGMIIDEPGTGKTLQFIIYLLECNRKSLVIVPNEDIKNVWTSEIQKHLDIPDVLNTLVGKLIHFETFDTIKTKLELESGWLNTNGFEILGIDEIHILYSLPDYVSKNDVGRDTYLLLEQIASSKIPTKWGITGTPFMNEFSFLNIFQYVTGELYENELIINIKSIMEQFHPIFLKNTKTDMSNDYEWAELTVHNILVDFDIVQRQTYDIESKNSPSKLNLRKLATDIQMMFDGCECQTPSQLKAFISQHYKNKLEQQRSKLAELEHFVENFKNTPHDIDIETFNHRLKEYQQKVNEQFALVKRLTTAVEYFTNTIEKITELIDKAKTQREQETSKEDMKTDEDEEEDEEDDTNEDEKCPICWSKYTPPIQYFKKCGHYFCDGCIKQFMPSTVSPMFHSFTNIKCPMCRQEHSTEDIIHVNEVVDINNSPKVYEILKLINQAPSDKRFIIFSQFNILDKLLSILAKHNIEGKLYKDFSFIEPPPKVLLLSSNQNAEGIDLTMFDNLVIFEPFEDHVYCSEIEKQLIARIHRVGRTEPVNVYRMITRDTIEEEIYSKLV